MRQTKRVVVGKKRLQIDQYDILRRIVAMLEQNDRLKTAKRELQESTLFFLGECERLREIVKQEPKGTNDTNVHTGPAMVEDGHGKE